MSKIFELLQLQIGKHLDKNPSPFGKWLDGRLLDVQPESLKLEFIVKHEMTNPLKILHGGVTAGIIDDMIGMTVAMLGHENFYVSINLSIDYLNSAQEGEMFFAESRIVRKGKTIVNAECILYTEQKKIIAKGTSNLIVTATKK